MFFIATSNREIAVPARFDKWFMGRTCPHETENALWFRPMCHSPHFDNVFLNDFWEADVALFCCRAWVHGTPCPSVGDSVAMKIDSVAIHMGPFRLSMARWKAYE